MSACRLRGLSLIEVLLVMVLITVLMALSLPMFSHANAEARAVICRQNLAEIGTAVTGHIRDYGRLPAIAELPAHEPGLSLPELVQSRLQSSDALFCPSDETDRSQILGTSYHWRSAFNGFTIADFERALDQTLVSDRESFHAGTDLPSNELILRRSGGKFQFAVTGSDDDPAPTAQPPAATPPKTGNNPNNGNGNGNGNSNGNSNGNNKNKNSNKGPGNNSGNGNTNPPGKNKWRGGDDDD